jgi:hypothetical protein
VTWPSKDPLTCKGNPPEYRRMILGCVEAACAFARFDLVSGGRHTAASARVGRQLVAAFNPNDRTCTGCGHHVCSCTPTEASKP